MDMGGRDRGATGQARVAPSICPALQQRRAYVKTHSRSNSRGLRVASALRHATNVPVSLPPPSSLDRAAAGRLATARVEGRGSRVVGRGSSGPSRWSGQAGG